LLSAIFSISLEMIVSSNKKLLWYARRSDIFFAVINIYVNQIVYVCPLGAYQNTQNKKYSCNYFVKIWHNWNTFVLFLLC
jgi:hypothetical protein